MRIDLSETFPHLSHAPIVEAVIDLRAKPSVPWNQEGFQARLKQDLAGYPTVQPQREFRIEFQSKAGAPLEKRDLDLGWTGLLFRSQDQLQVTQFQKEGFAFSRLTPYQQWETFEAEALRLWKIYVELVHPEAIQRVGVRFINRMPFPADGFRLDEYLVSSPQPLPSLGFTRTGFLYRDIFAMPGTDYSVTLNRTVQPAEGAPASVPVILDIDVFTSAPLELDETRLKKRLTEIRWLKNKVFFGSITEKTKEMFK